MDAVLVQPGYRKERTMQRDNLLFGEERPEADVAEQRVPAQPSDEDTWRDAGHITMVRDWEASEADLIEQAIAVPDDDRDFDR
jgi:hypothetical protein